MKLEKYKIFNKSCYGLQEIENNSIDALITDPPYEYPIKVIIGIKICLIKRYGKILLMY
jgi:DNA modification methylase